MSVPCFTTDRHAFPLIPLKDMDAAQLGFELLSSIQRFDERDRAMVTSAAQIAAHLHRGQTRLHRRDLPRVPYIEHPLRVALRILRWGSPDAELVTAALLHDTVEDCAGRIISEMLPGDQSKVAAQRLQGGEDLRKVQQSMALQWVGNAYGSEVMFSIEAVTLGGTETYMAEMERLVKRGHYRSLLIKASDLVDNAGSLRHQHGHVPDRRIKKLLYKYRPAVALIAQDFERRVTEECPVPGCYPMAEAAAHLRAVEQGLHQLVVDMNTEAPSQEEA